MGWAPRKSRAEHRTGPGQAEVASPVVGDHQSALHIWARGEAWRIGRRTCWTLFCGASSSTAHTTGCVGEFSDAQSQTRGASSQTSGRKRAESNPDRSVSLELSPNQFALLDYILDVIRPLATHCLVEGASVEPSLTDRESAGLAEVQSLADLLHKREAELVNGSEAEQSMLMYMSMLWDHYHYGHPLGDLIEARKRETCYDARIKDAKAYFDRFQQAISLFAPTGDWAGLEAWVRRERVTRNLHCSAYRG